MIRFAYLEAFRKTLLLLEFYVSVLNICPSLRERAIFGVYIVKVKNTLCTVNVQVPRTGI